MKKFYIFLFADCLYVNVRKENGTKSGAIHVILGYDVNGVKNILGLWICRTGEKHYWSIGNVLFISMDGMNGLEEVARSI